MRRIFWMMAMFVILGTPLIAILWQTLNELLALQRKDPITREEVDLEEHEEPVTTGTVFLTLIFLMMIFGFLVPATELRLVRIPIFLAHSRSGQVSPVAVRERRGRCAPILSRARRCRPASHIGHTSTRHWPGRPPSDVDRREPRRPPWSAHPAPAGAHAPSCLLHPPRAPAVRALTLLEERLRKARS